MLVLKEKQICFLCVFSGLCWMWSFLCLSLRHTLPLLTMGWHTLTSLRYATRTYSRHTSLKGENLKKTFLHSWRQMRDGKNADNQKPGLYRLGLFESKLMIIAIFREKVSLRGLQLTIKGHLIQVQNRCYSISQQQGHSKAYPGLERLTRRSCLWELIVWLASLWSSYRWWTLKLRLQAFAIDICGLLCIHVTGRFWIGVAMLIHTAGWKLCCLKNMLSLLWYSALYTWCLKGFKKNDIESCIKGNSAVEAAIENLARNCINSSSLI